MEKIPYHYQANAIFLKPNDFMNFESISSGVKTSLKFNKIPDFYVIDEKEYFAVEMKIEGLKVGTAALVAENILNIKLHESEELLGYRNLNFLIPSEANAKKASVEVFNDTIFIRVPIKKRHC